MEDGETTPWTNQQPRAMARYRTYRVLVDSRDRDVTRFPSASDFSMPLAVGVRGVKAIRLTDVRVPIVAGYMYVAVVIAGVPENVVQQCKTGTGFPSGVLAFVPLVPAVAGASYAYYQPISGGGGYRLEFPQALTQLKDLRVQLWAWNASVAGSITGWGGAEWAPILYPLNSESISAGPEMANNIYVGLEIEHQA